MSALPDTMTAIAITEPGGPDVLKPVTEKTPQPKDGEILIKVMAAGVNRPDCSQRLGRYPPPADASPLPGGVDAFFGLTAITYALTGLWAATWRLTERRPWLADIHFAGDILVVSGLVLYTGGAGSLFVSLYALPIVAACAIKSIAGAAAAEDFGRIQPTSTPPEKLPSSRMAATITIRILRAKRDDIPISSIKIFCQRMNHGSIKPG